MLPVDFLDLVERAVVQPLLCSVKTAGSFAPGASVR
jgi:hypothetical protein